MNVGLLILTHIGIGPALLGTAALMMDGCPLQAKILTASADSEPEEIMHHAIELIAELDKGDGVLILADLPGSTPYNVAERLLKTEHIRIVTGMNLSMLIRVLNYPQLGLDDLAAKAVSGGMEGIVLSKQA
ncbi:MAG: PTS fructose transporter subunit IIA [Proteobacteria bacterium]|nr:PTS fructose transporter subunit IIA [Pseudomonadota bacterium]